MSTDDRDSKMVVVVREFSPAWERETRRLRDALEKMNDDDFIWPCVALAVSDDEFYNSQCYQCGRIVHARVTNVTTNCVATYMFKLWATCCGYCNSEANLKETFADFEADTNSVDENDLIYAEIFVTDGERRRAKLLSEKPGEVAYETHDMYSSSERIWRRGVKYGLKLAEY